MGTIGRQGQTQRGDREVREEDRWRSKGEKRGFVQGRGDVRRREMGYRGRSREEMGER